MAENQFIKLRKEKLEKIRALGIDPYPSSSERTHRIAEVLEDRESRIEQAQTVTLTGRLIAMRRQGKIGFGNIEDASGKIQIYVSQSELGEDNYAVFKLCDPGDFVQVTGTLFNTQAGEYSLKCAVIKLLTKNIRPLPAVKEKQWMARLCAMMNLPISNCAIVNAIWTSCSIQNTARSSSSVPTSFLPFADSWTAVATWKWKLRFSSRSMAVPMPDPSSPITILSMWIFTCASRWSSI
jgi:hypothetical protein